MLFIMTESGVLCTLLEVIVHCSGLEISPGDVWVILEVRVTIYHSCIIQHYGVLKLIIDGLLDQIRGLFHQIVSEAAVLNIHWIRYDSCHYVCMRPSIACHNVQFVLLLFR